MNSYKRHDENRVFFCVKKEVVSKECIKKCIIIRDLKS